MLSVPTRKGEGLARLGPRPTCTGGTGTDHRGGRLGDLAEKAQCVGGGGTFHEQVARRATQGPAGETEAVTRPHSRREEAA